MAIEAELVFLILMVALNILFLWKRQVPLLGFVTAIVSFCLVAVIGSNSTNMPYYPLPSVLLGLMAVVTLFSSGMQIKRGS